MPSSTLMHKQIHTSACVDIRILKMLEMPGQVPVPAQLDHHDAEPLGGRCGASHVCRCQVSGTSVFREFYVNE